MSMKFVIIIFFSHRLDTEYYIVDYIVIAHQFLGHRRVVIEASAVLCIPAILVSNSL